ncbi:hypothetical protein Bca52824_094465 [Brassica carinata]|uniref:Small RNA 2'-O-methyltransferase n=1 Tax=Brassica carinata TaxID=52824 RepID=A0A8X7TIY4_BRACI|nr:hypothetical protein Bca52824_094465 [Brassica carinata]
MLQLGIYPQDDDDITVEQAWDDIVQRIKYIFSDELIILWEATLEQHCKLMVNVVVQFLFLSSLHLAAAKLSDYIVVFPHVASLRRKSPYPPAIIEGLATDGESIQVEAVYIQCATSGEEVVHPIILDISSGRYYLDIIAQKLGLKDNSQLIISRTFGKTPSRYECREYSAIPKLNPSDKSSKVYGKCPADEDQSSSHFKKPWNAKASYVCGQDIHGDAIVAAVGYSWREMLCMFCRQQQLSEPVFTISTAPVKPLLYILRSFKKLKDSESNDSNNQCVNEYAESDDSYNHYNIKDEEELPVLESGYRCEVKILSKSQDLVVLDCSQGNFYEKESHAIQNASLNKGACNLKSVKLYHGSILEFDSRLHGIDIATCLELERSLSTWRKLKPFQFGKTVLSLFRPKFLIVSTPNYEYNRILHKSLKRQNHVIAVRVQEH